MSQVVSNEGKNEPSVSLENNKAISELQNEIKRLNDLISSPSVKERSLIVGILLASFGVGIQFFGAWGIDFAFTAAINNGIDSVDVPFIGKFTAGQWWNLNFFGFFPLGAIMMIVGAFKIGKFLKR